MVWVLAFGVWALLLIAFPKPTGYASAAIACLGGVFFAWILMEDASNSKKYMQARADEKKVRIDIKYQPNGCLAMSPILLTVKNDSSKTVVSHTFSAAGYEKGRSSKLYSFLGSSDYIITPGQVSKLCYAATPASQISSQRLATVSLDEVIWKVVNFSPTFEN